jgi:hypothetical protein
MSRTDITPAKLKKLFPTKEGGLQLDLKALEKMLEVRLPKLDSSDMHFLEVQFGRYLPFKMIGAWAKLTKRDMPKVLQQVLPLLKPADNEAVPVAAKPKQPPKEYKPRGRAVCYVLNAGQVRQLHAALIKGSSFAQAATETGLSRATIYSVRTEKRLIAPDAHTAWDETFGIQPIAERGRGGFHVTAQTKAQTDITNAALIRRVYELLRKDVAGGGKSWQQAATALGLSKPQIRRIVLNNPSHWGPNCSLAWNETFGALQDRS